MPEIMVDSNVLLDVLMGDPVWSAWSSATLEECVREHALVINVIVLAEISISFDRIEDLNDALQSSKLQTRPIPPEAAFLAGRCFEQYRRRGGQRHSLLPDFLIGAHAAVKKMSLITRDIARYRTYFPTVKLICP